MLSAQLTAVAHRQILIYRAVLVVEQKYCITFKGFPKGKQCYSLLIEKVGLLPLLAVWGVRGPYGRSSVGFFASLYYKVVVFVPLSKGMCYTVRDAVDWFMLPTA